jgi:hypothetical protein
VPAPPLAHTFESGQPDGTTITTGNSGVGGDAFQTVTGDCTYSTVQVKNATLSGRFNPTATPAIASPQWTGLGLLTGDLWGRFYLWIDSLPSTEPRLVRIDNDSGAGCAFIAITPTTGTVDPMNAAQGGNIARGTVAIAIQQWTRIEFRVRAATSNGQIEWWLYNSADAAIGLHDDTNSTSTAVLAANADRGRFGLCTANSPADWVIWMDDIALSTAGQIGPGTPAGPPPVNPDYTTFPKSIVRPGRAGGQPS